jgi:hypothetical protein
MISDVKQLNIKTIIKISFKNLKQNYIERFYNNDKENNG